MELQCDEPVNADYGSGLLVLLGAGASYDCLRGHNDVAPPMTDHLAASTHEANRLLSIYPLARPVVSELRRSVEAREDSSLGLRSTSLEESLRLYVARAESVRDAAKHVAAFRFYLRDLLFRTATAISELEGGINNYTRLVADCRNWAHDNHRVLCFVNFNYDPLLEWACGTEFGFNPSDPAAYSQGESTFIVKPHGSVLWSWVSRIEYQQGTEGLPWTRIVETGDPSVPRGLELRMSQSPIDSVAADGVERPVYPAMAMPTAGAKSFVWPLDQEALFTRRFSNGTFGKILVVGWRASEPHFVPLLARLVPNSAKVLTVTGSAEEDVQEIRRNLSSIVYPTTGVIKNQSGFSDFMRSELLTRFLDS